MIWRGCFDYSYKSPLPLTTKKHFFSMLLNLCLPSAAYCLKVPTLSPVTVYMDLLFLKLQKRNSILSNKDEDRS